MTEQLLSFNSSGFQYAWDATSISAYEKCPRYYQLRHIEGWQRPQRNAHLLFGGVYASALEHYAKYIALGQSHDDALREVFTEALIATWIDGAPWQSDHNAKTRETLLRSIVWYLEEFLTDPAPVVLLADGKPAVELSFSVPFSSDYMYCGHIDKLVEYGGNKFIMDQKTTGTTISPYYFKNYSPDIQMSGYTWAGSIMFDLPVSGVIIDAAQIAVGFTRFARGFINLPRPLLDEWYENTLSTIEDARRSHEADHYRMTRTSCGNFGGCDFRSVCSRIPEHRQRVLQSEYERQPRWDPLQRR